MKKGLLFKSSHFHAAMQNKWRVTVYQHDELLDQGGIIESQTRDSVKIGESYFIKSNCQFVVGDGDILQNQANEEICSYIELIAFIEDGILKKFMNKLDATL